MDTVALRSLCVDLAHTLADVVRPDLGAPQARGHGEVGAGGDITFRIDERAETELARFLADRAPEIAWYSEDQGLIAPAAGLHEQTPVLIVDPIDGTRPAIAGFEAACVSVAAARYGAGTPTMRDVEVGVIVEIKSRREFVAVRGQGLSSTGALRLSPNTDLSRLFWVFGFRGRPARELICVLGDLIDRSSVGGGVFDLGSACFDSVAILTGQLDAFIEPGPRMIDDVPATREAFERVGNGAVLNNAPYDVAAAVLCLQEGGAIITDCSGRSLDDRPLLGSGHEFQMSILAASNTELHHKLVAEMDAGIARLRGELADRRGDEGRETR
jgi:myo-inositol-1(or 4)-monophosphatase